MDPVQLSVPIDSRGSHTWDALQAGDTIHLVYEVSTCRDEPQLQAQRLDYLSFTSTGEFQGAAPVVNGQDNACSYARNPALAPRPKHEPVVFYSSNVSESTELYEQQLGSGAEPTRLTFDPSFASDSEEHTVAVAFGAGGTLLAYVNTQAQLQGPSLGQIVTRVLGSDEQEIVARSQGVHIAGLALGAFPPGSPWAGLLAWVAEGGTEPGIMAQLLDENGRPSGKPILLSSESGASSNVSIQFLPESQDQNLVGALVYGVTPGGTHSEIRFRPIYLDGKMGSEELITTGSLDARGVGITPFASGYALAYRVATGAQPVMKVRIVDLLGNPAAYSELRLIEVTALGSAPKLFVTSDGRFSVVFTEERADGPILRVVRATCDP